MYMLKPYMQGKNVSYQLYLKKESEVHQERLRNMKSHIKSLGFMDQPKVVSTMNWNPKKRMQEDERFHEVEAENARLLGRMTKILEAPPKKIETPKIFDARQHKRNEDAKTIKKKNAINQERIEKTSAYYNVEEWEEERRKTEHALKYMGLYPYTPPRLKKKAAREQEQAEAEFLDNYWQRTMAAFSEAHPEIVAQVEKDQPQTEEVLRDQLSRVGHPSPSEWMLPGLGRPSRYRNSLSPSPLPAEARRSGNVRLEPLRQSEPTELLNATRSPASPWKQQQGSPESSHHKQYAPADPFNPVEMHRDFRNVAVSPPSAIVRQSPAHTPQNNVNSHVNSSSSSSKANSNVTRMSGEVVPVVAADIEAKRQQAKESVEQHLSSNSGQMEEEEEDATSSNNRANMLPGGRVRPSSSSATSRPATSSMATDELIAFSEKDEKKQVEAKVEKKLDILEVTSDAKPKGKLEITEVKEENVAWKDLEGMTAMSYVSCGIGVVFAEDSVNNLIVVKSIDEHGPVAKANTVLPGDLLLKVNGESVHGKPLALIQTFMMGKPGEYVDLEFLQKENAVARVKVELGYTRDEKKEEELEEARMAAEEEKKEEVEEKKEEAVIVEEKKEETAEEKKEETAEEKKEETAKEKKEEAAVVEEKKEETAEEKKEETAAVEEAKEEPAEEKKEETVVVEEKKEETAEEKKEETAEEKKEETVVVEEAKEEPAEEKKEETVVVEEKKEEPAVVEEKKEEPAAVEEAKEEPAAVEEKKEEPAAVEEKKEEPAAVEEAKEEPAVVEEKKEETAVEVQQEVAQSQEQEQVVPPQAELEQPHVRSGSGISDKVEGAIEAPPSS